MGNIPDIGLSVLFLWQWSNRFKWHHRPANKNEIFSGLYSDTVWRLDGLRKLKFSSSILVTTTTFSEVFDTKSQEIVDIRLETFHCGSQQFSQKKISNYRQDCAKRKMPKIRFFAQQGRLIAPIHVKLGTADGHVGPLGCGKFHLIRRMGWEYSPQQWKISIFG